MNYFNEFTLELRFKAEDDSFRNKGATLVSYAFQSYGRRYFALRITKDEKMEGIFEIRDEKSPNKLLKFFNILSDKVSLEKGKFHTLRIASRSGGECRIWLDGMLIARKKGALSFSDFKGSSPAAYPLFTLGCSVRRAMYEDFFHGLIDDVKLYDSFEEPPPAVEIPADASVSRSEPNLVLNGESTGPFLVPDRETALLGNFEKADAKFIENAASARLNLEKENLVVSVICPIPEGTKPLLNEKTLWHSDHIEFFFQPDPSKEAYYQYSVAFDGRFEGGKFRMHQLPEKTFRSRAESQVNLEKDRCGITLRIPRKELGIERVTPGQAFAGNLIRSGATSGGNTFWKNPGQDFHNSDGFGILIAESRKAYFENIVTELLKAPRKDDVAEKVVSVLKSQIEKNGESPAAWDTIQKNIQNLRSALTRAAMAGKPVLLHDADMWGNHFAVSPNTLPLKKLNLRGPLNTKIRGSFVFSNLSARPYMGRIKFFSVAEQKKRFNQTGDAFAARWKFFEALPIEDTSRKMLYDTLAPLTLNSVFRSAPHSSTPLYFELDTKGLAAGTYHGCLILKPSYSGFPEETLEVALTLENVDLSKVKMDSFTYGNLYQCFF